MKFNSVEDAKIKYLEGHISSAKAANIEDYKTYDKIIENQIKPAFEYVKEQGRLDVLLEFLEQDDDINLKHSTAVAFLSTKYEENAIEVLKEITGDNNKKMEFSEESQRIFLLQIHEMINKSISFTMEKFKNKDSKSMDYFVFDESEEKYINEIKSSPIFQNIIKKILTRNLEGSFFNLICLLDGVTAPDPKYGKWKEVLLIDRPPDYEEDPEILNESFYETYDEWERINKKY